VLQFKQKLSIAISLFFLTSSIFHALPSSASGPKTGAKCPVEGFRQTEKSIQYVCTKSGKKLKWKKDLTKAKSFDVLKTYSTDLGYMDDIQGGPCAVDPLTPPEWKAMEQFSLSRGGCGGQIRLAKYELGVQRPKIDFEESSKFSELSKCKISINNDRKGLSHEKNPWREERKYPSPNTVIQLIPIYSSDSKPPSNTPAKDYEKFLKYMKEWIDYSSDFGSDTKYRIPSEYIKFDKKIGDYKLQHPVRFDEPNHVAFNKDVIEAVDAKIDFTGAHIGIIVAPAGTDAAVMQQAALGSFQTNEGKVPVGLSQFADLPENARGSFYSGLTHPFWWIHEVYHAGFGLDDHYGDTQRNIETEYGMGWWTMMTPWGGDLSIWEKWLLGFVRDSQFQCAPGNRTSTHWLAPSSVRTTQSKSVIVPVSNTKVIVVESMRVAGLNYKIAQENQGALVYEIDFTKEEHGMGMKLSLPLNRKTESLQFFLSGATLKPGDYTISNGYKISVVESGTFGDVIRVEKA
jgi:hypothetical protein